MMAHDGSSDPQGYAELEEAQRAAIQRPDPNYTYTCQHGVSLEDECSTCNYNESLGYDADVSDPSQHCKHGTFIGSWWGPDYLCGQCEMGDDWPEALERPVRAAGPANGPDCLYGG